MPAEAGATGAPSIAITVIGGYLGTGKTTLLNALLRDARGRRLGVIVNDFGELGVDASSVSATVGSRIPVANLANGCVCCTLGDDLGATLLELASIEPRLDHIVIEASGVADPASIAAWGTVPPFGPGGTIVLAAADGARRMSGDRYVGGEVLRQFATADLLVVTRSDLVDAAALGDVVEWLSTVSAAPTIVASMGDVDVDVVLGVPLFGAAAAAVPSVHADKYERWTWRQVDPVSRESLDSFLAQPRQGMLRLKGLLTVRPATGSSATVRLQTLLVQGVGTSVSITAMSQAETSAARPVLGGLEAIGIREVFDVSRIERSAIDYLSSR